MFDRWRYCALLVSLTGVVAAPVGARAQAPQADRRAAPRSVMVAPNLPPGYSSHDTAHVIVQFTVDTAGRVDPGSVFADPKADTLLAAAARAALIRTEFVPALKHGVPVPDDVEQEFTFAPPPLTAASAATSSDPVAPSYQRVQLAPGSPDAEYPLKLARAGIEGEVEARFTIDSAGVPDAKTFYVVRVHINRAFAAALENPRMLETDSELLYPERGFVEAVKKALPRMRFMPLMDNGHPVGGTVDEIIPFRLTQ